MTVVCFVVASAVGFITGKGPAMLQAVISKQIEETMSEQGARVKEELRREFSNQDLDKMKNRYETYVR